MYCFILFCTDLCEEVSNLLFRCRVRIVMLCCAVVGCRFATRSRLPFCRPPSLYLSFIRKRKTEIPLHVHISFVYPLSIMMHRFPIPNKFIPKHHVRPSFLKMHRRITSQPNTCKIPCMQICSSDLSSIHLSCTTYTS